MIKRYISMILMIESCMLEDVTYQENLALNSMVMEKPNHVRQANSYKYPLGYFVFFFF